MRNVDKLELEFHHKPIADLLELYAGSDPATRIAAHRVILRRPWAQVVEPLIVAAHYEEADRRHCFPLFRLLCQLHKDAIPTMFGKAVQFRKSASENELMPAETQLEWRTKYRVPATVIERPVAFDSLLRRKAANAARKRAARLAEPEFDSDDEAVAEYELESSDERRAEMIASAISQLAEKAGVHYALTRLGDPDPYVNWVAAMVLEDPEEFPLEQLMRFIDSEIVCRYLASAFICEGLSRKTAAKGRDARSFLREACRHESVRKCVSQHLFVGFHTASGYGPAEQIALASELLIPLLRYPDIRADVVTSLTMLPDAAPQMTRELSDLELRPGLMTALEEIGEKAVPSVAAALSDPSRTETVAIVLSLIGDCAFEHLLRLRDRADRTKNRGIYLSLRLGGSSALENVMNDLHRKPAGEYLATTATLHDAIALLTAFGAAGVPRLIAEISTGTHGMIAAIALARLGAPALAALLPLVKLSGGVRRDASIGLLLESAVGVNSWFKNTTEDDRRAIYRDFAGIPAADLRVLLLRQLLPSVRSDTDERLALEEFAAPDVAPLLTTAIEEQDQMMLSFFENARDSRFCAAFAVAATALADIKKCEAILLKLNHRVAPTLVAMLGSSQPLQRENAGKILRRIGPDAFPWLCAAIRRAENGICRYAIPVLGAIRHPGAAEVILSTVDASTDPEVRHIGLKVLTDVRTLRDASRIIWKCALDSSPHVVLEATRLVPQLASVLRERANELRERARRTPQNSPVHTALRTAAAALEAN